MQEKAEEGKTEKWNQEVMCFMLFHFMAPNLASKGLSITWQLQSPKAPETECKGLGNKQLQSSQKLYLCPLQEQVQCQLSDAIKNV